MTAVSFVCSPLNYFRGLTQNLDLDARALFERTVAKIEPEKAKPIWDRWMLYEYQYGDFPASQKLAARYSESFPEGEWNSLTLIQSSFVQ